MPALYVAFLEELTQTDKCEFESLDSQDRRAEWILNHSFIRDKFNQIQVIEGKDNTRSVRAREEGNRQFQEGHYQAALLQYSTAVAFADQSKPDYSLALANRSAALQRLNKQNKSVEDIDAAVDAGYPKDKLYKIIERKGQCLAELGKFGLAEKELRKAEQLVQDSGLSEAAKHKFVAGLKSWLVKVEGKEEEAGGKEEDQEERLDRLTRVKGNNPVYPALAEAVQVKYTKEQGRFVTTNSLLPAGTVVMSEEPLAWSLDVERTGTYCQHCLAPVLVIVPCPRCASVAFCSRVCMEAGVSQYHRHECGLVKLLAASALNNFCLMAVRAVARHTAKELVKMKNRLETEPDIEWGKTKEGMEVYSGQDLRTGLNLVHHTQDLDVEEKILRTMISIFLMTCLKRTHFYPKEGLSKQDDFYIAGLLYTLINACPANTHEVHHLATPTLERWSPMCEIQALGSGLYPTAALFNHSCDPNIMRVNVGKRMVSVACRDIAAGEELVDCYGLPWYKVPKEKRQYTCTRFYKFQCQCVPCEESWPVTDLLGLTIPKGELTKVELDSVVASVNTAMERLTAQLDWDEGIPLLRDAQAKLKKSIQPPTLEYFHCTIAVWRALWLLVGNKRLTKMF